MVAPNDNRCRNLTLADKLIDRHTKFCPLPVAKPADARRQALEADALLREFNPAVQTCIFREQFKNKPVCADNVLRVTGECDPAKWAFSLAEKWTNVFGHKSRNFIGIFYTCDPGLGTQVVAVIKGNCTSPFQFQHRLYMLGHGAHRTQLVFFRIALTQLNSFAQVHPIRNISLERIMRAGLVSQKIRNNVAANQLRQHVSYIGHQPNRTRLALAPGSIQYLQRFIKRMRNVVAVSTGQALLNARRINIDSEKACPIHSGCQGLRATHSAHSARNDKLTIQAAKMSAACLGKSLVCSLHDALTANVDPRAGSHLAIHHQALLFELVKMFPV